jgi:hypothetical protein
MESLRVMKDLPIHAVSCGVLEMLASLYSLLELIEGDI